MTPTFDLSPSQLEAIEHFSKTGFIGIAWHLPGQGKTRLALACALKMSPAPRLVVIVAPKAAQQTWRDEICKIQFPLPWEIFSSDNLKRIDTSVSYEGMLLIVDELYYFSSPGSKRSKALKRISRFFPHRIGLSGTIQPASDNITIYGQVSAMGLNQYLAPTAAKFRAEYQTCVFERLMVRGRVLTIPKPMNKPDAKDRIIKKIRQFVHVYFPDDNTRDIHESQVDITLSKPQLAAIEQIREEYQFLLNESTDEWIDYQAAMQIIFSVCKVTNGWIAKQGHDIERTFENAKLTALKAIIEPLIAAGERVVIWCNFRNDVHYLEANLPWPCLRFMGGEQFDTRTWSAGHSPLVLATIANGASVNHFGNVKYAVYYSMPLKLRDFLQSKGRHERKDSTHSGAYYYYLLAKNPSFDRRLFGRLSTNQDAEQSIIQTFAKAFLKGSTP